MSLAVHFLEWDSRYFELRCGRMLGAILSANELNQVLEQAQMQSLECLYYLADPGDPGGIRLLEQAGFRLVDIRLTFESDTGPNQTPTKPPPRAAAIIQPALASQIPDLRQIALESYQNTRFLNDPGFDPLRARELYATWIENSVRGYADQVLVAAIDNRVSGFISMHMPVNDQPGTIGLVGVAPQARGQGLGLQLVHQAVAWFRRQEVGAVQVVTQAANQAAQRLYQRAAFNLSSTGLWYHKWFKENG